jgi:division protein CdvB (Snf7/Vps24/ESCRT-III family)
LKPRLEQATNQIQSQITKLDNRLVRLKERDSTIFKRMVTEMQKHDAQMSSALSNELAEVRKTANIVNQSKIALEQTTLRLNTVKDLGDMVATVAPAMGIVRSVRSELINFMPEAGHEMGEIGSVLSSILVDAGRLGEFTLNFKAANEDAERILAEASIIAEKRMKEQFPEIPATTAEAIQ